MEENQKEEKYEIIRDIGILTENRELILEQNRVMEVLQAHENNYNYSPQASEECLVCLETIIPMSDTIFGKTLCCGLCICRSCSDTVKLLKLRKCPSCRAYTPQNDEETFLQMKSLAEKGDGWGMTSLAAVYETGTFCEKVDIQKAIEWYTRAAEKKENVEAMISLGNLYEEGVEGILRKSIGKALYWFTKAAEKGDVHARVWLGKLYYEGYDCVIPINEREAVRYFTLALSEDYPHYKESEHTIIASFHLAKMFEKGYVGLPKSLYRAMFYAKKVAESKCLDGNGNNVLAICQAMLAKLIVNEHYFETHDECGYRLRYPACYEVLYWYRKSFHNCKCAGMHKELTWVYGEMNKLRTPLQSFCGLCSKTSSELSNEEGVQVTLKNCARCKSIWYCSKECQISHWKKEHKTDCRRIDS